MACALGPSATAVPKAIQEAGIISAPFLLIIAALINGICFYVLFKSAILSNVTFHFFIFISNI